MNFTNIDHVVRAVMQGLPEVQHQLEVRASPVAGISVFCGHCRASQPIDLSPLAGGEEQFTAVKGALEAHLHLEPLPAKEPSYLERLEQRAPLTELEKELKDPDLEKLDVWFRYHKPTEEQVVAYQQIRDGAYMLARTLLLHCPRSADRTAALRKLRECVMTANASIACGGV